MGTSLSNYFDAITTKMQAARAKANRQYAYVDEIAVGSAIDAERIVKEFRELTVVVELNGKYTRYFEKQETLVINRPRKWTTGSMTNKILKKVVVKCLRIYKIIIFFARKFLSMLDDSVIILYAITTYWWPESVLFFFLKLL